VLLSYLAVTSPGADVCAQPSARCEAPAPPADDEGTAERATPAEVDCRWLGSAAAGAAASHFIVDPLLAAGACDQPAQPPITYAWYHISRTADSERAAGALGAARARRGLRLLLACDRSSDRVPLVAPGAGQPLALVVVPTLAPPPPELAAAHRDRVLLPLRTLDPPDRPPRG